MFQKWMNFHFQCLLVLFGFLIFRTNPAPKTSTVTTEIFPNTSLKSCVSEDDLLTLTGSDGVTCTKLKTCLLILIDYTKPNVKHGVSRAIYSQIVPSNAFIEGNCQSKNTSFMQISWDEYKLTWNFAKTPEGKWWYVNQLDFIIDTRKGKFRYMAFCGRFFKFSNTQALFPTPIGKSYQASNKTVINLSLVDAKDISATTNFTAKLFIEEPFQLQPFMDVSSNLEQEFDSIEDVEVENDTRPFIADDFSSHSTPTTIFEKFATSTPTSEINKNATLRKEMVYSGPSQCVELKTDGLIEITFKSPISDNNVVSSYVPNDAIVEESCLTEESWIRVSWEGYSITWTFLQRTADWRVTLIEIIVCTENKQFQSIAVSAEPIKLSQSEDLYIRAYSGSPFYTYEMTVDLSSTQVEYSQYNVSGKLILKNFQLAGFQNL